MRPPSPRLAGPLLALALAPAALAAAPAPAAPAGQPVAKGAVISVDLSRLPSSVERRGVALCLGARVTLAGAPEEVRCQRPFAFQASVSGDPLVLVFRPVDGGRPTRLEFPFQRDPRPRTFTAPSAGTLTRETAGTATREAAAGPKGAAAAGAPAVLPPEQAERARAAAAATCGDCRGAPAFTLKDYTLEAVPPASQEVVVDVRPPAP